MRPTHFRHYILGVVTLVAFLMYLDRICLQNIMVADSFKREIPLGANDSAGLKSAFFWAYALAQVPAGWLAERFGKRLLMTWLIVLWSAFTALTGFSTGLTLLLIARIGCGLAEAGAYPISGSLLRNWVHVNWRGLANGIVSLGGRVGGAAAPVITALVISASGNWRLAGWSYGLVGIVVAIAFWRIFRETPALHPLCNDAERALLMEREGTFLPVAKACAPFPWRPILTNVSLWAMCFYQFFTNVGWAFLVNSLADYLKLVHKITDDKLNGTLCTTALSVGLGGLVIGGLFTDYATRRLGVRRGRLVPLLFTRFIAAAAYVIAIWIDNPWLLVSVLGVVAFSSDAGLPAAWAFAQDVGGRNVAPVFGWANMWGNFGAALQPPMVAFLLKHFDRAGDWHVVLYASALAFLLAGACAVGIDASAPIEREA